MLHPSGYNHAQLSAGDQVMVSGSCLLIIQHESLLSHRMGSCVVLGKNRGLPDAGSDKGWNESAALEHHSLMLPLSFIS